jgi:predicted deacylase
MQAGTMSPLPRSQGDVTPEIAPTLRVTVDYDRPGKQFGTIWVPDSANNMSAWGNVGVPVACIKGGSGPTVLLMAGNHGDEYESQVAILGLLDQLAPAQFSGRVIALPVLSPPASKAGTRLWPDGTNFNRAFPGTPGGSVASQLAHYLTTELFPLADVVCDFHTGGRSLAFRPMATMHLVSDKDQRRRMVEACAAMGTGSVLVYLDTNGGGLLPSEAEAMGKTVVTAELGGGALLTPVTISYTRRCITNVLRHVGVLQNDAPNGGDAAGGGGTAGGGESPEVHVLQAMVAEDYVLSPVAGLYEPIADLGATVAAGDLLGAIYSTDDIGQPPRPVYAETAGVVAGVRAITTTSPGDCLALVAQTSSLEDVTGTEDVTDPKDEPR